MITYEFWKDGTGDCGRQTRGRGLAAPGPSAHSFPGGSPRAGMWLLSSFCTVWGQSSPHLSPPRAPAICDTPTPVFQVCPLFRPRPTRLEGSREALPGRAQAARPYPLSVPTSANRRPDPPHLPPSVAQFLLDPSACPPPGTPPAAWHFSNISVVALLALLPQVVKINKQIETGLAADASLPPSGCKPSSFTCHALNTC